MDSNHRGITLIALFFLMAGTVMAAIGIVRGEMFAVFTKAARICLECIGIG